MPNGKIFMTGSVLRDLVTGNTYGIPVQLRGRPVNTLVTYTLTHPNDRDVSTVTSGMTGLFMGSSTVDEYGNFFPVAQALRDAYPVHTPIRFCGTSDEVSEVDALTVNLGAPSRRVNVVDTSAIAPEDPSSLGVSVEQDAQDKSDDPVGQVYYHIGAETAWTTRVRTCTALAMWSRTAQISYLSHADSSTDAATIAENMKTFLDKAMAAGADLSVSAELTVTLFLAEDTLGSRASSLEPISKALGHLPAAYTKTVFIAAKCHIIHPANVVIVSSDKPPAVRLQLDEYLEYLLTQYAIRGDAEIGRLLAKTIPSVDPSSDFESLAYHAAKKAHQQGDDQLCLLLGQLSGYGRAEMKERWQL
ncbi:MAG TPA: hypothetical protein VIR33_14175 [Thermopolyspora sp.]|jgi:hypothetical protein